MTSLSDGAVAKVGRGLTGAVDTVIIIANKGGGAVLDVRGRDVESAELAIQFSKDACRWTILGAAAEVHQSNQRKAIIAALVERGEPMKITEIMGATGMKRNNLEALLGKLVKEQAINRIGIGLYVHNGYTSPHEPGGKSAGSSDRSDRPHTDVDQTPVRPQATDKTQESARSDRSDYQFTSNANHSPTSAETDLRVNIRSDQSGRSDERAKPLSGFNNGHDGDLIARKSDRSDQSDRMLTDAAAADEELASRKPTAVGDDDPRHLTTSATSDLQAIADKLWLRGDSS